MVGPRGPITTHVFWAEDPGGKFIDYLMQSRQFADKIYTISHNCRGYDAVSVAKVSGTEMDTPIDNGRYLNSEHVC